MIRRRPSPLRRLRNAALTGLALAAVVGANGPVVVHAADYAWNEYQRHQEDYKKQYGFWETIELPEEFRLSAVHAALLHTGEVLLIAGSGNNAEGFDAGTFRSILWDPVTGDTKEIPTPEDLFCAGHAYLPNGNLLIAGGTREYEQLEEQVDHAAGVLALTNGHDAAITLPEGSEFAVNGLTYLSTEDVTVPAAHEMPDGAVMAGAADVWVEAEGRGDEYVVDEDRRFGVRDLPASHRGKVHASGNSVTKEKQNFQGLDASYEFDVATESYRRTGRLDEPRWYPTLINLQDGRILAVSGLDEYGRVLPGDNEIYDPGARTWTDQPELFRYFPTYPALFRLADGQRLFYSGSNTGYGPADQGRQPGIWNLADNSWTDVPGLEDPEYNETSASFFLAPVQDQRVGILGGGLVGDSDESTARFNVADLSSADPHYVPAPDYPSRARYINAVTLPDDRTLLTGGSQGYRGNGESDLHLTTMYDPHSHTLHEAAPNQVGRNYHATALLLPDGRVMTMGSDPLFADVERTKSGTFETRIEIYSPPYLFAGDRPALTDAPTEITRGDSVPVSTDGEIAEARLLRPSAVTHQTDTEQRSIALEVAAAPCPADDAPAGEHGGSHCPDGCCGGSSGDTYELTVPAEEGLTPAGWYMLVVLDDRGVPSPARWVHVR